MSMLLAFDVGNSYVKWAYHDGTRWRDPGRAATAHLIAGQLAPAAFPHVPQRIVVGNVAGQAAAAAIAELCRAWTALPVWVSSQASGGGVTNRYDDPAQLGVDRWAALVAARALTEEPALVVSVGTAMTVDMLNGDGEFLGGIIVPGPELMRTSLRGATAGVAVAAAEYVPLPRNTAQAVEAGILHALLGAVARMERILTHEAGAPPLCLLTGGGAAFLAAHLARPCQHVETLVLEGLRRLAEEG